MNVATKKFGSIEFSGKDIAVPSQKFDRIAVSGRSELLLLSLIAETHNIKRIRAILCNGAKATIMTGGVRARQKSAPAYNEGTNLGRLTATADGYQLFVHKLGYGLAHGLFLTRMPGFLKIVTPESLWQELKGSRFTTPLIKEWMPHVESVLREEELLEDAYCFNCQCGVLSATTKDLDEIVEDGLKKRHLLVVNPALAMTA